MYGQNEFDDAVDASAVTSHTVKRERDDAEGATTTSDRLSKMPMRAEDREWWDVQPRHVPFMDTKDGKNEAWLTVPVTAVDPTYLKAIASNPSKFDLGVCEARVKEVGFASGKPPPAPILPPLPTEDVHPVAKVEAHDAAFVDDKLASQQWKVVIGEAKRDPMDPNGEQTHHYHEIIVDSLSNKGSDDGKVFQNRDRLKQAGYTHYSGSEEGGWQPFKTAMGLPIKGQGRTCEDQSMIDRFERDKAAHAANPNKIQNMINSGEFRLVRATSSYEGVQTGADVTYEFVIDGTVSTFKYKEDIKAAGYSTYSKFPGKDLKPFTLPGGKQGFGRIVSI